MSFSPPAQNVRLNQFDLAQVSVNHRNCMQVMYTNNVAQRPKDQKIVIGDSTGHLHMYQVKRGESQLVYRVPVALPSSSNNQNAGSGDHEIRALCVGGSSGASGSGLAGGEFGSNDQDRVFVSTAQKIVGIKKKGKEFFSYNSQFNESINNLWVANTDLYTTSAYSFSHLQNGQELYQYQSPGRINALLMSPYPLRRTTTGDNDDNQRHAILGCQDKYIRVLSNDQLLYQHSVSSAVTTLHSYHGNSNSSSSSSSSGSGRGGGDASSTTTISSTSTSESHLHLPHGRVLYGTINGEIGELLLSDGDVRCHWSMMSHSGIMMHGGGGTGGGGSSAAAIGDVDHDDDVIGAGGDQDGGGGGGGGSAGGAGGGGGGRRHHQCAVSAMTVCDVTGSGQLDIVVGYDDGRVTVYGHDVGGVGASAGVTGGVSTASGGGMSRLQILYDGDFGSCITSLDHGYVMDCEGGAASSRTGGGREDIVLSTYAGRVIVLSSLHRDDNGGGSGSSSSSSSVQANEFGTMMSTRHDSSAAAAIAASSGGSDGTGGSDDVKENQQRIVKLQQDIARLHHEVDQAKSRYTHLSRGSNIAVQSQFSIRSSLHHLATEACYLLTIEIDVAIDMIALRSDVPVMLIDQDHHQDAHGTGGGSSSSSSSSSSITTSTSTSTSQDGSTVLSVTECDPLDGNELLVTYRCQNNCSRVELKLRTVEGQHGRLSIYVLPRLQPKTSQTCHYDIAPLSLHEAIDTQQLYEHLEDDIHARTRGGGDGGGDGDDSNGIDDVAAATTTTTTVVVPPPRHLRRIMNHLDLTGDFSLHEIHIWLSQLFPDVAPRAHIMPASSSSSSSSLSRGEKLCNSITGDTRRFMSNDNGNGGGKGNDDGNDDNGYARLVFESSFLHTIVICEYRARRCRITSDSLTTISVVKEVLSRAATSQHVAIDTQLTCDSQSIFVCLQRLRYHLDRHFLLAKQWELIAPLQEIALHEDSSSSSSSSSTPDYVWLNPQHRYIMHHTRDIQSQYALIPRHLDFLRGMVTDLYIDGHKLLGRSIEKTQISRLLAVLDRQCYDYAALVQVFRDAQFPISSSSASASP